MVHRSGVATCTTALAEGLEDVLPRSETAASATEASLPEPEPDARPVLSVAVLAARGPETALNRWQATADENAFCGWQMAWRQMLELGFDPYRKLGQLYAVGTHDNVVYEVLAGRADAGTVCTNTLGPMEQEGLIWGSDFALVHENTRDADRFPMALSTRLHPEWPFAIMPKTAPELAEQVAMALMGIAPESEAAADGGYAGWTVPSNDQSVGDTLRMLRVAPYEDHGEVNWRAVVGKSLPVLGGIALLLLLLGVAVVRFRNLNLQLYITQGQLQGELGERRRAEGPCARPTAARTSLSPPLPTNCATRWRRFELASS